MQTKKVKADKIGLIAHRGLSGIEVENTRQAFIEACKKDYYGIETDIRYTADKKLVVFHDDSILRLNGSDILIKDLTYQQLLEKELLGGLKKEKKGYICPLDEYIEICNQYDKYMVIEFKDGFILEDIKPIIDYIEHKSNSNKIIYISFNMQYLKEIRKYREKATIQYLCGIIDEKLFDELIKYRFDVDMFQNDLNIDLAKRLKAKGIKINMWTVDDPSKFDELKALGVDYITTNILENEKC